MPKNSERDQKQLEKYYDFLSKSLEFARLWAEPEAGMTAIIEPRNLGADPFLFGMALVDAARHGAKAYAQAVNISEEDAISMNASA